MVKETKIINKEDLTIEYHVEGNGETIVLLPSRGRHQGDFDVIANYISEQGFKVIRPEYRGIGNSTGPMEGVSLYDLAEEVSIVLDEEKSGPGFIIGHAFGNWIARIVAVKRPDQVKGICVLAAASKGKFAPYLIEALDKGSDLSIPDEERIEYLRTAFFTPNGRPEEWLRGWSEEAHKLQREAPKLAPQDEWWSAGGKVPILEIRAELDPFAPKERANEMREMFGDRVLTVEIPNASHGLVPEQPEATVAAIVTYAKQLFNN